MSDYLKIIIRLDGSGVYYSPAEPIHIDALIAWALAPIHGSHNLTREDVPMEFPMPLAKRDINGSWVWVASALYPEGYFETTTYWRKRLRQNRIEMTHGSPNLTSSTYRDWQMPLPLSLTRQMVGYAVGDRRDILRLLRRVPALGKKRAYGYGRIVDVAVERIEQDYSLLRDGHTMRWLPHPKGGRLVRPRPPYWHPYGRVRCLEIGEAWST